MKKLIHTVEEKSGNCYRLWAELIDCDSPQGVRQLKFTTQWTGAKDTEREDVKGEFFLDPESLVRLQNLLQGQQ